MTTARSREIRDGAVTGGSVRVRGGPGWLKKPARTAPPRRWPPCRPQSAATPRPAGPVGNPHVAELADIDGREFLVLGLLAVCVLAMGLYPFPFTEVMHASVDNLLKHVAASKL